MESNSEEQLPAAPSIDQPFNPEEAAIILELTERQKKFADAILAGCNQTRAAELAGYSGKGATLRSTASTVMKSPAVRAYLDWAANGRTGSPVAAASVEEIERKLSEHLRGSDKASSIRAAEVLSRLHSARMEAARDRTPDPIESLDKLAGTGEFGLLVAMYLAKAYGLANWAPKIEPAPGAEDRQRQMMLSQLTPGERQRAQYIANRNNSVSPVRSSADGQAPVTPVDAVDGADVIEVTGAVGPDQERDVWPNGTGLSRKQLAGLAFRSGKI